MMKGACRQAGFTLLEVLVALLVIAIGLLGIAGMQALAINNTSVARVQSLAAIQAASLAATMQANEAYWTIGSLATTTVVGQTLSDATLNGQTIDCSAAPCTLAVQMAGYDLKQWGQSLQTLLPGGQGAVTCTPGVGNPVTCTISVSWQEKNVALSGQGGANLGLQTYSMVVQP